MLGLVENLKPTDVAAIHDLIAALTNGSPVDRQHAREALAAIGRLAVDPLIRLLGDHRPHVRWEAVKALGSIADPAAAPALVGALEDEDGDVRWLAAEGLIGLGLEALQPLLSALACGPSSSDLLEGAHHVLYTLDRRRLPSVVKRVLVALAGSTPHMAVHLAAYTALKSLRAREPSAQGDAQ
jgi:HEAT repeat protein